MLRQNEPRGTRSDSHLFEFLDLSERRRGDEAAYFRSVEELGGLGGLGQPFVDRLHARALASRKRVLTHAPDVRLSTFPAVPERLWHAGFLRTLFFVLVLSMHEYIWAACEGMLIHSPLNPGIPIPSEAYDERKEPEACEHPLRTWLLYEATFDLFCFFVIARGFRGRADDFLELRLGFLLSCATRDVACFGLVPGTAALATKITASFALWAVLYGVVRLRPSTPGGDWALRTNA
jgi:hypothetical protein